MCGYFKPPLFETCRSHPDSTGTSDWNGDIPWLFPFLYSLSTNFQLQFVVRNTYFQKLLIISIFKNNSFLRSFELLLIWTLHNCWLWLSQHSRKFEIFRISSFVILICTFLLLLDFLNNLQLIALQVFSFFKTLSQTFYFHKFLFFTPLIKTRFSKKFGNN